MSTSSQWETVTKSRKQKNLEKKVVAHIEKKREEALQPKLEEILPSHQIRKLLTSQGKENLSPSKSNGSSSKSKGSTPKRTPKTFKDQQHSQSETKKTKQEQQGPKQLPKPKSLEQAFKALTPDDFASHLEQYKILYQGSLLSILKATAAYVNSHLQFEYDPVFSGKSVTYPSNLASTALKKAIVEFISSGGEANIEYFFHYILLESMCTGMNNNVPVVGYKFLLQLIAQYWPHICSSYMANTAILRNSYQNRSNICLSILWAIGQGGYQNLMEGIKVWQNLMLPNLEMRSYCRFVSEYIEKILNTALNQSLAMNQSEFFHTYNALKANYSSLPRECQQALMRSSEVFLQKHIASSSKHANLFLTLLRDIENPTKNRMEVDGCLSCLLHDDDCFKVWKMNYKKQLLPTIYLLQKIECEIFDSATALAMCSSFHDFLLEAVKLNAELDVAKKRDPNVDTLFDLVKFNKWTTKSNNSSFLKQIKQTGGGPPPVRLNSFDEQLVSRLPKHFEHDVNIYDSNCSISKSPTANAECRINQTLNIDDDQMEDVSVTHTQEESPKSKPPKRKIKEELDENSKRMKLLDVSIEQKDLEMKYFRIEFERKTITWEENKKLLEMQIKRTKEDHNLTKCQNEILSLQIMHMKEEHELNMEKIHLEVQNLKKSGYFT